MSAINLVVKRHEVLIATDGVSYDSQGVIQFISQKCFPAPTAGTVVASIGVGFAAAVFSIEIGMRFRSFDEVVLGIEEEMPKIYLKHLNSFLGTEFTNCDVYFAGWSQSRGTGEAYKMNVCEPEDADYWRKQAEGTGYTAEPFKLQPLTGIVGNPPPTPEQCRAAGLTFHGSAETVHELITPVDLLHLLEVQRRMRFPLRPNGDYPSRHWVGGIALLTTITKDCVTQRALHRWSEDCPGQVIEPLPIEWKSWRAEREATLGAAPQTISKLRRDLLERKARKAARNAGAA